MLHQILHRDYEQITVDIFYLSQCAKTGAANLRKHKWSW